MLGFLRPIFLVLGCNVDGFFILSFPGPGSPFRRKLSAGYAEPRQTTTVRVTGFAALHPNMRFLACYTLSQEHTPKRYTLCTAAQPYAMACHGICHGMLHGK